MPDPDALFWPRSIALVGASPDPAIIRGRIVEAVTRYGFDGTLHAVSRSHDAFAGIVCHPTVEALPGPVDLAIITIPPSGAVQISRGGERQPAARLAVRRQSAWR